MIYAVVFKNDFRMLGVGGSLHVVALAHGPKIEMRRSAWSVTHFYCFGILLQHMAFRFKQ